MCQRVRAWTFIAYFFDDPPTEPLIPIGLRAPELAFENIMNRSLDIWCFGCLVFELLAGQPLFSSGWSRHPRGKQLLYFNARIGPLPDKIFNRWKTSSLYFTPDRALFNCAIGGVPEGREPLMLPQQSLEEIFDETAPEISPEENDMVKKLMRRILKYNPEERPSAADILQDLWFQAIAEDGSFCARFAI